MRKPGSRSITIREVATLAKVSPATAASALRDEGRIKAATRERVLQAARTLGYVPNRAAALLASRRYRDPEAVAGLTIVLLSHQGQADQGEERNRHIAQTERRAHELGYQFEHRDLWGQSIRDIGRQLEARGVAGLVIGRIWPTETPLPLPWNSFALVAETRTFLDPPMHRVRQAAFADVQCAWNACLEAGYTRIGPAIMSHQPPIADDLERYAAVAACQKPLPKRQRIPPLLTAIGDMNALTKWVERHRPDAVIGFHIGGYYALQSWAAATGHPMPGFISLHASRHHPHIAGLMENRPVLARETINLLDQQLREGHRGLPEYPIEIAVPSLFQPGSSLTTTSPADNHPDSSPSAVRTTSRNGNCR